MEPGRSSAPRLSPELADAGSNSRPAHSRLIALQAALHTLPLPRTQLLPAAYPAGQGSCRLMSQLLRRRGSFHSLVVSCLIPLGLACRQSVGEAYNAPQQLVGSELRCPTASPWPAVAPPTRLHL